MSKREVETSLTNPADAVSAFAHHTPGTVAAGFPGLEKGNGLMGESIPKPDYLSSTPVAEESTLPPVANGMDWFRFAGELLVAEGRISQERLERALAAQEGVIRA